jgi:hypothetical protein
MGELNMKVLKYKSSVTINRAEHDIREANRSFEYFVSMTTSGRFRVWFRSTNNDVSNDFFMPWGSAKKTFYTEEAAHGYMSQLFAPIPASQVKMEGESA